MATEETTITELELAEEVLADMVIPVDTSTDTKSVSLKQLRAWLGSSLPTGFIIASFGKMDDERFTLLDGKTLSKQGTYGAFCAKVEEQVQAGKWFACSEEEYNADLLASGQCSKFVIGVDYVRIPKLGNSLCSGVVDGKIPVVGNGLALGLNNGVTTGAMGTGATAGIDAWVKYYGQPIGQGIANTDKSMFGASNGVWRTAGLTTDPTKSGIEAKINSVEVFYYMVISTEGQTSEVGIDINKVYEDLNLKANSDLSNVASVSQTFKDKSVSWGKPDYNAGVDIASTLLNYASYTAPYNCYIHFSTYGNVGIRFKIGNNYVIYLDGNTGVFISEGIYLEKGETLIKDSFESGAMAILFPLKGVN